MSFNWQAMSARLILVRTAATLLGLATAIACATGQQAAKPEKPAGVTQVSLEAVAKNPAEYLDRTVQLHGKLENEGTNYFSDLRVVLKDDNGNQIHVRPWLPLSTPPAPPGSGAKKPATLATFLGKNVELEAVVEKGAIKKAGEVYLLNVKSAKVLP